MPACRSDSLATCRVFIDAPPALIILSLMIRNSLLSELHHCRSNLEAYEGLIWPSAFPLSQETYAQCICLLIQESERLHLTGQTKFTAKKYFDICVSHSPALCEEELVPTIVGCLRTAVKQCESRAVSQLYTLQYAADQCGQLVPHSFFLQLELKVLSLLNMRTKLVTPFCFFELLAELFPEKEIILPKLKAIIDFMLTQPECTFFSAEELFFCALIACFKAKKASPICFTIIQALTPKWQEAMSLANLLNARLGLPA